MKARFAVCALLCACFLSGCMRVAHFYPIQGPLASQTPPPIYSGRITAVIDSGSMLGAHLFARTILTGNQGAKLQLEMISEPVASGDGKGAPPEVRGVGRDGNGNVYRVSF